MRLSIPWFLPIRRLLPLAMSSLPLLLMLPLPVSAGDRVDQALSDIYAHYPELSYLGYDSVENPKVDRYGAQKYMVLDFFSRKQLGESEVQANVHRICTSLLRNRALVRDLATKGYDMVAVTFDAKHQYDCL